MNQSQWIKLVAVVAAVSFIGGVLGASLFSGGGAGGASGQDGRELRIVDKKGALRVFLGVDNMTTVMKLYGEDGKVCRFFLNADAIGSAVEMYGQDGRARIGMGVYPDGTGAVRHDNDWRILWTPGR